MFFSHKVIAVLIFVIAYFLIIIYYNKKMTIVWASIAFLFLFKILTIKQAISAINWNVLMLYFGMLFVSEVFLLSRMPGYLATLFASKAKTVGMAMLILCAFSGLLSTCLENVAVVLLVAPIALSIAKKCNISPVPLFIGIAVSSNLQGSATLIGDPPSMLLAGYAHLTFNDFFVYNGKPGIFFAIQLGAVVSLFILYSIFHRHDKDMHKLKKERYVSIVPSILVILMIVCLIIGSSLDKSARYMTGLICLIFGFICFTWHIFKNKKTNVSKFLSDIDWQTGLFLIGIFILVESIVSVGLMEDIANFILGIAGNNPFFVFMMIVWMAVLISAFVDNVPFLLAMLPVTAIVTANLGVAPYPFYIALLIGASVGGNVTPIGASANIVAMGIVRRQGYNVKFMDFVKIGLPFTIFSVLASTMFIWFLFF